MGNREAFKKQLRRRKKINSIISKGNRKINRKRLKATQNNDVNINQKKTIKKFRDNHLIDKRTGRILILPYNIRESRRISNETRKLVFERDGGKCSFEGCESTRDLEIDHIKPVSRGGDNSPRNLRLLCRKHNRKKSNKPIIHHLLERTANARRP